MLVAKQPLYQPQPPLQQPVRKPQKQSKTKPAVLTGADKRLIIVVLLLTAVMSLGMIWRFASINDMQTRLSRLERGITTLENDNAALTIQLKQLSSPRKIEDRANAELGMGWPQQNQIINVLEARPEQ